MLVVKDQSSALNDDVTRPLKQAKDPINPFGSSGVQFGSLFSQPQNLKGQHKNIVSQSQELNRQPTMQHTRYNLLSQFGNSNVKGIGDNNIPQNRPWQPSQPDFERGENLNRQDESRHVDYSYQDNPSDIENINQDAPTNMVDAHQDRLNYIEDTDHEAHTNKKYHDVFELGDLIIGNKVAQRNLDYLNRDSFAEDYSTVESHLGVVNPDNDELKLQDYNDQDGLEDYIFPDQGTQRDQDYSNQDSSRFLVYPESNENDDFDYPVKEVIGDGVQLRQDRLRDLDYTDQNKSQKDVKSDKSSNLKNSFSDKISNFDASIPLNILNSVKNSLGFTPLNININRDAISEINTDSIKEQLLNRSVFLRKMIGNVQN